MRARHSHPAIRTLRLARGGVVINVLDRRGPDHDVAARSIAAIGTHWNVAEVVAKFPHRAQCLGGPLCSPRVAGVAAKRPGGSARCLAAGTRACAVGACLTVGVAPSTGSVAADPPPAMGFSRDGPSGLGSATATAFAPGGSVGIG